ncbi:MAG: VWA domain-containing protein [Bacteroidales bacterium]|jgi:Ca-activated chloride channel family protein|nr:VWA domain-containing protein [Bacteroidales bacterium]
MKESNFAFAHPEYFNLLYGLVVLIVLLMYSRIVTKKRMKRLADSSFYYLVLPDISFGKAVFKWFLLSCAYIALVFALARPQFGLKLQEVKQKGIELVIALDVSNSMSAEDISPSRIERAKLAIQRMTDNLKDDKIAIVVFAGGAYTLLPLTTDISAAKMMIKNVQTDFIKQQGTSISTALQQSIRSFTDDPKVEKAIVLISDGEDHDEDALKMVARAQEKGIRIFTVGMGTSDGVPIPVKDGYGRRTYMQDRSGRVVTTKLNEAILRKIAEQGEGMYSRADFNPIIHELNSFTQSEFETKKYSEYDEKFQYFLAIAILFILIESLFLDKKNKYLQKYSLFK